MMEPYPWPSSRIGPDLMSKLHHISQATRPRVPITELVKRALVEVYLEPEVIADHVATRVPQRVNGGHHPK